MLLASGFLFSPIPSCTGGGDCFLDSECDKGKICSNGTCVTGSRDGDTGGDGSSAGGDPFTLSDLGPPGDASGTIGPTITILHPAAYELLSDIIEIKAEVVDDDGVDPSQVMATIGDLFNVPLAPGTGAHTFVALFDSRQLGLMAFPTIVVTAYDVLGNKGVAGHSFALDNVPPILSFSSPMMQAYRDSDTVASTTPIVECSAPFNPLGDHALAHGDVIDANYYYGWSFYARLRIEDMGNALFYNGVVEIAGVDDTTTALYILDNTSLRAGNKLVLGDGSGLCTHINPAVLPDPVSPSPMQAVMQRLVPIPGRGEPDFSQFTDPPPNSPCTRNGVDKECRVQTDIVMCYDPPKRVCDRSERITMWITYNTGGQPAIYVPNAYDPDNLVTCIGGPLDALSLSSDGPACLVATATDKLGHVGFSKPIAICVDRYTTGVPCAGFDASIDARTLCSDGCTAPDYGTALEMFPYNTDVYR